MYVVYQKLLKTSVIEPLVCGLGADCYQKGFD